MSLYIIGASYLLKQNLSFSFQVVLDGPLSDPAMTISTRGSPASGDSPPDSQSSNPPSTSAGSPQQPPTPQSPMSTGSSSTQPPSPAVVVEPSPSPPSTAGQGAPPPSVHLSLDESVPVQEAGGDDSSNRPVPVQHEEAGGAGDVMRGPSPMEGEAAPVSEQGEEGRTEFPLAELGKLDEMISRPRWVVPVLPNGELEILLDAAIELCKKGNLIQIRK